MISWKVSTYGRVSTLEETLFSFLNQEDLNDCECVIINDYPLQTLIFNHPQVRIFNIKEPFKTIGEKENFAVEQCKGNIIAVTDDDDIYLSNHNSNIKKYFKEDTNILHWMGVYYNEPEITSIIGIGNSGMIYSKKAWELAGKHPIMNAGGDTVFANNIHKLEGYTLGIPPDEEVSAFYRWHLPLDGGVYHQSGAGTDDEIKPNIIERHSSWIEQQRRKGFIKTGNIQLVPKWRYDYKKMLEEYIKNNKK